MLLLVVLMWPSSEPEPQPVVEPETPAVAQPEPIEPEPADTFEATPPPEPVDGRKLLVFPG